MLRALCLVALLACGFAARASDDAPVINQHIISEVNSANNGWVAGVNAKFAGMTLAQAKKFLGVLKKDTCDVPHVSYAHLSKYINIPDNFDARTQWPGCVHEIRDQAQCGSCWAFGATEAFSDRLCVASKGAVNVVLSPQDLVSCESDNYGCDGGYLDRAWNYMASTGVVEEKCFPYSSQSGSVEKCIGNTCKDGKTAAKKYKVKSGTVRMFNDPASIQLELMTNGPMEAAFAVYQDFFSYKSGVYSHKSGGLAGYHAVKLIGWGKDAASGQDYWLLANSWGTSWGENGFFKIARGHNECEIESQVYAGIPSL